MSLPREDQFEAVNRAFSRQSDHYDADDFGNDILQAWRKQVYLHVNRFLKPNSHILELNAGTGIDALHFVKEGHRVHATDLSDGMIRQIQQKISQRALQASFTCQQCSFENLAEVQQNHFDYVFSNFGGLNCTNHLSRVTQHFSNLLKPGGYATLVIMPPICPWEIMSMFKGNTRALRRLKKNGAYSLLEGEHFQTYYYSLAEIKRALGAQFKLIKTEGLGALSPPPSRGDFPKRNPGLYEFLCALDFRVNKNFPFNRWADHIIATFQFSGS